MPNCLSGSPSCSSRMLRSTLSNGWLTAGPATAPDKQALEQLLARELGPGVQRSSSAGRRAACDPITSIDPIVRGAQR